MNDKWNMKNLTPLGMVEVSEAPTVLERRPQRWDEIKKTQKCGNKIEMQAIRSQKRRSLLVISSQISALFPVKYLQSVSLSFAPWSQKWTEKPMQPWLHLPMISLQRSALFEPITQKIRTPLNSSPETCHAENLNAREKKEATSIRSWFFGTWA